MPPLSHRLSLGISALVLVLTIVFHATVVRHPYGFAFAIFIACLVIAIHIIALAAGWQRNGWAYFFLAPVMFGTMAEALYASDVVRVLGFALVLLSLAFFSYWIAAPTIRFSDVKSLWSRSFFFETLLPVQGSGGMLTKASFGTSGLRILIGIGIAIPFLFVIGTFFAAADPLFQQFLSSVFRPTTDTMDIVFRIMVDVVVAIFLGRVTWAMITRVRERRLARHSEWHPTLDHVILTTFLGLLNVLFLVFLAFQFIYFFGGEAFVKSQGLTYAHYARSGFFQLLFVAVIVFGITWFMYRMSEFRHAWVKVLNVTLILETGVVIASAIKRLMLYVDTYGLTVSRWWAAAVILIIGFVLLSAALGAIANVRYGLITKVIFLSLLWIFSGLLLMNVEGKVARFNIERYTSGKTARLDLDYLLVGLSVDALPVAIDLLTKPETKISPHTWPYVYSPVTDDIGVCLRKRVQSIRDQGAMDWRNLVWSDYQAMRAMKRLDTVR